MPTVVLTPLVRVSALERRSPRRWSRPNAAKPASSPMPAGRPSSAEPLAGELDDRSVLPASRRGSRRRARPRRPPPRTRRVPGVIEAASRLPYVIVPVLSSRMTSTSPEASTARPLMARTLKRATRSMPAMPIADRSPPIVVGMRHTSRATSATVSTVVPAYSPERPERHRRHQEDDRQAGEQDRQGDLVGRSLPLGALDEGDHPVEEGLARVGRDADHDAVADERRPTGHGAPDVGARLLEDGRRLAGDRGLVDEPDPFDDVAVTGDRLASPRRR